MAIAHVQHNQNTVIAGTSTTVTLGAATTPGNLIVVVVTMSSNFATADGSVSDDGSNSYTQVSGSRQSTNARGGSGNPISVSMFYKANCAAATNITVSTGGGNNEKLANVYVYEFSGVATASAVDVSGGTNTGGTGQTSIGKAITLTQADDLIVAGGTCGNSSMSVSSPLGNGNSQGGDNYPSGTTFQTIVGYELDETNTGSQTYTVSFGGGTVGGCIVVAAFKKAAPATSYPDPGGMMMGMG